MHAAIATVHKGIQSGKMELCGKDTEKTLSNTLHGALHIHTTHTPYILTKKRNSETFPVVFTSFNFKYDGCAAQQHHLPHFVSFVLSIDL